MTGPVRKGWKQERQGNDGEVDRWILVGTPFSVVQWNEHGHAAAYKPNEHGNAQQIHGDCETVGEAMQMAEREAGNLPSTTPDINDLEGLAEWILKRTIANPWALRDKPVLAEILRRVRDSGDPLEAQLKLDKFTALLEHLRGHCLAMVARYHDMRVSFRQGEAAAYQDIAHLFAEHELLPPLPGEGPCTKCGGFRRSLLHDPQFDDDPKWHNYSPEKVP